MGWLDNPIDGGPIAIAVIGVTFFGTYMGYVTVNDAYLRGPIWLWPLGLVLIAVLFIGLVYGSYWLIDSSFTAEQSWRVTIWVLAGLIGAVALTFWPIFYQRVVGVTIADPLFILLVSAGIGANAGIIAGVAQLRSEHQFEQVQETKDSLEFLNRLLRHNVLNAINIIDGYASLVTEQAGSETVVERARTIRRQSDQLADLIENTRVLVRRIAGDIETEPVDFTAIVAEELERAASSHSGVEINRDLAPAVRVEAHGIVSAVVANVVSNAITHNDHETPTVDVTLRTENGSAILTVADNGPGIPEQERDVVVNPGPHGDHGLGLYLVDTLVTQYDGTVTIGNNKPRGTVVAIELPLA